MKVTFTPLIAILTAFVLWGGPADAQVRVRGGYYRPFYYRPYFGASFWYGSYGYPPF